MYESGVDCAAKRVCEFDGIINVRTLQTSVNALHEVMNTFLYGVKEGGIQLGDEHRQR